MNEDALVIENLYMKYNSKDKQFVLENLNFKIKKGIFMLSLEKMEQANRQL